MISLDFELTENNGKKIFTTKTDNAEVRIACEENKITTESNSKLEGNVKTTLTFDNKKGSYADIVETAKSFKRCIKS